MTATDTPMVRYKRTIFPPYAESYEAPDYSPDYNQDDSDLYNQDDYNQDPGYEDYGY